MPGPRLGRAIFRLLTAALAVLTLSLCFAVQDTIESIEIRGLRRMTKDAFVFASGLKVGDPYDPQTVRTAFKRLYDRGLFNDLKVEVEDGETGRVLIFTVSERPIVVSIDYDQVKSITRSNIEDRFKERSVELTVGKPLDRRVIGRAVDTIKDLLGEKGYLDATVQARVDSISQQSSSIHFRIKQGPRTRIKQIEFVGNEVFKDRKLRGAMKLTKEHSLFSSIGGKDIYFPLKYDQDIEKVRELYQNSGYLDVEIRAPQVEIRETDRSRKRREKKERERGETAGGTAETAGTTAEVVTAPGPPPAGTPEEPSPAAGAPAEEAATAPPAGETGKARKKRLEREEAERKRAEKLQKKAEKNAEKQERKTKKWVYLTVRVREGDQYRLGELKASGNTVFSDQEVINHIPLRSGAVLNRSALDAGIELLRGSYGEKGYIYASIGRRVERKEGDLADVTIDIREDRPYRVETIEFEGNTTTRDSVLRREIRINEGEVVDKRKLNLSMFKLNQLGYIAPVGEPVIEPIPGSDRVRVRVPTEEKGRNEIQVGGGYSGQEGFFFAGSYSTRNFLGRGETVGVSLQVGGRSSRYQFSFTEPWFLGKPVTAGFNLFRRDIEFADNSTQAGSGGSLLIGRRLGDFASVQALYSFESIDFTDRSPTISGRTLVTQTTTQVGSITPSIGYNRVNNPFRPSAGHSASFSTEVAGSYLGGDNNFFKPLLQGTQYLPISRRQYFGFHGEFGLISPYGKGATFGGQVLGIPRFERYFLGGDQFGPRIFETRSISPVRFISVDGTKIARDKSEILKFKGRDIFGQRIEVSCREEFDFTPGDGRCSNGLRQVLIGGDRFALAQLEYNVSTGGPFVFAVFLDAGTVLAEDEGFGVGDLRLSAGIETRIYLPVFQAPLRFIFGRALRQEPFDNTNNFQFSIGQSF